MAHSWRVSEATHYVIKVGACNAGLPQSKSSIERHINKFDGQDYNWIKPFFPLIRIYLRKDCHFNPVGSAVLR